VRLQKINVVFGNDKMNVVFGKEEIDVVFKIEKIDILEPFYLLFFFIKLFQFLFGTHGAPKKQTIQCIESFMKYGIGI